METTYALNENETLQEIKRPPRIGFIKTFAGTTPPEGTLLCDGSAVSRNTYSELFAAIGTTWGSGDGTNTFNLPDLRDAWILCAGTEHEAGDVVAEGLPNITGTAGFRKYQTSADGNIVYASSNLPAGNAFSFADGGSQYKFADYISFELQTTGYPADALNFNASNHNSIYGASQHVTPASVAALPCIVYE